MAAIASIEDLAEVKNGLESLKERFPQAHAEFVVFFAMNKRVGYRNIIRMMSGAKPEELKE